MPGVILPVVVREQSNAVIVAKFERWVGESVGYTKCCQTRTEAAHSDPVIATLTAQNEAGNDDVAPGTDEGPRTDVRQLGRNGLAQVVDLNQSDTRGVVLAPNDCGIGSGIQSGINR